METTTAMSARSLQYYVIARRWLSDLEFFKIETSFLHRLLDSNISRLKDNNHIDKLITTGKTLQKLEQMEVDDLLNKQIKQLELMAEDIIPEDTEALASTQVQLEYFMTNLTREFRLIKQELFNLILDVEHEDKLIVN
ncbi:hypothetical protein [Mucilaginibacter sp.]|uniref:hypothetical protein n=1 Tax=Mucilaginibacter sp. TaxID=1882438 RepID=UPI0025EF052E|nr:hypothetical protein [Mucilaginibacter sp.]